MELKDIPTFWAKKEHFEENGFRKLIKDITEAKLHEAGVVFVKPPQDTDFVNLNYRYLILTPNIGIH